MLRGRDFERRATAEVQRAEDRLRTLALAQLLGEQLQPRGVRHRGEVSLDLLGALRAVALAPARLGVVLDQLAQLEDAVHQGLRAWRAAGHVHVDRHELVGRDQRVVVEDAHRAAAGAHRDRPLGLEHLVVEAADDRRHLDRDPARQDDQVGLARGGPEGLEAEARDVHARAGGLELLHRAAGQTESEREERVRASPGDGLLKRRGEHAFVHVAFELLAVHARGRGRAEQLGAAQQFLGVVRVDDADDPVPPATSTGSRFISTRVLPCATRIRRPRSTAR